MTSRRAALTSRREARLGLSPVAIDWEAVAREAVHPLRIRIIERVARDTGARFSSAELALEWNEPLGNVSYHVRTLHAQGFLSRAGQRTVRGALQRYYKAGSKLHGWSVEQVVSSNPPTTRASPGF